MTKDVLLKNENGDEIYPCTKLELVSSKDGSPAFVERTDEDRQLAIGDDGKPYYKSSSGGGIQSVANTVSGDNLTTTITNSDGTEVNSVPVKLPSGGGGGGGKLYRHTIVIRYADPYGDFQPNLYFKIYSTKSTPYTDLLSVSNGESPIFACGNTSGKMYILVEDLRSNFVIATFEEGIATEIHNIVGERIPIELPFVSDTVKDV